MGGGQGLAGYGIVSCPDLYSPAAKNSLGTIEQTARPLRGVTVMTYAVIAGDRVGIT